MTPQQFYRSLGALGVETVINLQPGPLLLKVNANDGMAARLLLWLYDNMPEDATQGDLDSVLDSAKWWSTFWASLQDSGGPTLHEADWQPSR